MARKKQRHVCKDLMCFHGAFSLKSKAKAKAATLKKARVKFSPSQGRFLVLTKKGK